MLTRKKRKAANTWFKLGRPIITSGDKAGQHDSERITAQIQVIPEDSFNDYGDRKVTGFTLTEIQRVIDTGEPCIAMSDAEPGDEPRILARIVLGPGINEFTKAELQQIIDAGNPIITASPLDAKDRARLGQEKMLRPHPGGRPKKNASGTATSANGSAGTGSSGSADSESDAVSK